MYSYQSLRLTLIFAITVALATFGVACMWDRDTLAMEMKRFPGAAEAIVGRFERNPPKYYEMRVDRLNPILKSGKATLEELDDLAVAYDRLGKGDEAIDVMAEKAKRLKKNPNKEHQYRYHANLGTFQVHKWLREGAKKESIALANASLKNIQTAIKINPDAHFGREAVQLKCIEWLIETKTQPNRAEAQPLYGYLLDIDQQKVSKGLTGLIVLGNAWESIDVIHAIGKLGGYGGLDTFATLRNIELYQQGKHAVDGSVENQVPLDMSAYSDDKELDEHLAFAKENYEIMRKNAKEYEKNRTAFMLAKMDQGKHPDTDPNFWDGYKEVPPAQLKKWSTPFWRRTDVFLYGAAGVIVVLIVGFIVGLRKMPRVFRIR